MASGACNASNSSAGSAGSAGSAAEAFYPSFLTEETWNFLLKQPELVILAENVDDEYNTFYFYVETTTKDEIRGSFSAYEMLNLTKVAHAAKFVLTRSGISLEEVRETILERNIRDFDEKEYDQIVEIDSDPHDSRYSITKQLPNVQIWFTVPIISTFTTPFGTIGALQVVRCSPRNLFGIYLFEHLFFVPFKTLPV